jgi:hypothetical protein
VGEDDREYCSNSVHDLLRFVSDLEMTDANVDIDHCLKRSASRVCPLMYQVSELPPVHHCTRDDQSSAIHEGESSRETLIDEYPIDLDVDNVKDFYEGEVVLAAKHHSRPDPNGEITFHADKFVVGIICRLEREQGAASLSFEGQSRCIVFIHIYDGSKRWVLPPSAVKHISSGEDVRIMRLQKENQRLHDKSLRLEAITHTTWTTRELDLFFSGLRK